MAAIQEEVDATPPDNIWRSNQETPKSPFRSTITTTGTSTEPDQEPNEREGFGNSVEFVLTCLGFSCGLGNIWRFPTRAYENGGSAFLIPYLIFGFLFGLPALYIEFLLGQYQGKSPPIVFRRIMPILEGLGWMAVAVSTIVGIYYIFLISWVLIYLVNTFRWHFTIWNKCDNEWNVAGTCIDMLQQKMCQGPNPLGWNGTKLPEKLYYIGGKCQDAALFSNVTLISATEQYFTNYVVRPSSGLFDFGGINWSVLASMTVCWVIVALALVKGTSVMGKISYVAVVLPFVIVVILFCRGIFLEGASTGLYYYMGTPDYGKLMHIKTWTEALKQLSFSLSIGQGGLMNFASYSRKHNNVFKDALIILFGDTMMSLMGGAAVFSTLGFLAVQRGVTVPEVVQSGFSLAFVVYPEAVTQMPMRWLWGFLFFLMLFLLGFTTQIALVEVFCSCLYDQSVSLSRKKWLVVPLWCLCLFICGLVFTTDAGFYWLQLFDEYSAGLSSICMVLFEVVVAMFIYGFRNFKDDITEVIGEPRNALTKAMGPHSPYFIANWMVISPIIAVLILVLVFIRDYPYQGKSDVYPPFFDIFGWFVAFLPVLMVPLFAGINYHRFRQRGVSLRCLFMLQKQHASYTRISQEFNEETKNVQTLLPSKEPWDEEPQLGESSSEAGFEAPIATGSIQKTHVLN